MKRKVIITAHVHAHLSAGLEQLGYEVHVRTDIAYGELVEILREYEGLVVASRIKIDRTLIDQGTKLKWIGRLGSGMEIIDVAYAAQQNINCISSPEGNRDAVAEMALGMLISLMRHLPTARDQVRAGQWIREENRGAELRGKTVGIIGYGNTGRAFATLLGVFGVAVLACDKYLSGFSSGHVREVDCAAIEQHADVISFHVPLTPETNHYADQHFFHRLQRKPYLINTSRGSIVDTDALLLALDEGLVAGAGLDVLENEDFSTYSVLERKRLTRLSSKPNVLITPHIAGYSDEAPYKMAAVLLEKLKSLLED